MAAFKFLQRIQPVFLSNFGPSFSLQRNSHRLPYVEYSRKLQALKQDDRECSMSVPDGRFVLFSIERPLLEPYKEDEEHEAVEEMHNSSTVLYDPSSQIVNQPPQQIAWLTYPEVREICSHIFVSNVLLNLSSTGIPNYAVQVGKLTDSHRRSLKEMRPEATCQDMRFGLFTISHGQSVLLSTALSLFHFHKGNLFCGTCGAKTFRNAAGSQRQCKECAINMYPNSRPVGIVLVSDKANERVLLVRQPKHPPGMYTCVAGFADVGETLEQCVRREVAEEAGVEVSSVKYLGSQHWPFPGSLMTGCLATARTENVSMDTDELEDARWFTRSELQAAVTVSRVDPMAWFAADKDKPAVFVPPPYTIAHRLMWHWLTSTT